MTQPSTLNRRSFLKVGAAAGGGLMIGTFLPTLARQAEAADAFEPNIWVRIDADDTVRIMLTQLEMGQGVMTSMPMLVAEDLDIDWNTVTTEWVGADLRYGIGFFGEPQQLTAGSNSVRAYWQPLREAGAAARLMLITAAAQQWGVPEGECSTDKGVVLHQASSRRVRYGALVDAAAALPVPIEITLKDPSAFKLLGQDLARLDIPEKVDGSAEFGLDVTRPDMLIARIVRCPVFGGTAASFDATKAKAVKGVHDVILISTGVAVVADTYWAASRGAQALEVTWNEGPLATLTTAEISRRFKQKAEQPGVPARNDGDADAAMAGAAQSFERVFEVPYLAHATMEPMNCTAHVQADRCDVWVPTQGQTPTHAAAVEASGLRGDQVFVHPTYLGGGFGRRGESDFVTDAVETSKALARPVKVVWSREDDMQHDWYRPYTYVRMWAALDAEGNPIAWKQRLVQPSLLGRVAPGGLADSKGIDFISLDGAANLPYDIPNVRVEYTEFDPGIPFGFWRSVGASVNGYVVEAFFDEVAAAGGKDPYELRRQLLSHHPRHKAALELAAEKHGWSTPAPVGRSRGIAILECFGSIIGLVAEVSVSSAGAVRVHKLTCAVDCGWVIHPDTIKGQMEGGLLYGLTAALKGEITIERGRVAQSNFHDYQMLRHNEAPEIDVHIVPNTETPGGIGEPSTATLGGALVNAIAAATGRRIYTMPIRPEMLRDDRSGGA